MSLLLLIRVSGRLIKSKLLLDAAIACGCVRAKSKPVANRAWRCALKPIISSRESRFSLPPELNQMSAHREDAPSYRAAHLHGACAHHEKHAIGYFGETLSCRASGRLVLALCSRTPVSSQNTSFPPFRFSEVFVNFYLVFQEPIIGNTVWTVLPHRGKLP